MASTEVKPPEDGLPAYGSLHGHYWVRQRQDRESSPAPWEIVRLSGPFRPNRVLGIRDDMTVIVEYVGDGQAGYLRAGPVGRLLAKPHRWWYEIGPKIETPPDQQGVKG